MQWAGPSMYRIYKVCGTKLQIPVLFKMIYGMVLGHSGQQQWQSMLGLVKQKKKKEKRFGTA